MRSHELINRPVVDADGRVLGDVLDLRVEAAGQTLGGAHPDLTVVGVVVSARRAGGMWGYERDRQQGPWLLRVLLQAWHRDIGYLAWEDVRVPAESGEPLRALTLPGPLPPLDG